MKGVDLSNNVQMGTQGYAELAKLLLREEREKRESVLLYNCRGTLPPALAFMKGVDLSNNVQMGTQGYAELAKLLLREEREKRESVLLYNCRGTRCSITCYKTEMEL